MLCCLFTEGHTSSRSAVGAYFQAHWTKLPPHVQAGGVEVQIKRTAEEVLVLDLTHKVPVLGNERGAVER